MIIGHEDHEEPSVEDEWRAAEAALATAQKMPGGPDALRPCEGLASFDMRPTSDGARLKKK